MNSFFKVSAEFLVIQPPKIDEFDEPIPIKLIGSVKPIKAMLLPTLFLEQFCSTKQSTSGKEGLLVELKRIFVHSMENIKIYFNFNVCLSVA